MNIIKTLLGRSKVISGGTETYLTREQFARGCAHLNAPGVCSGQGGRTGFFGQATYVVRVDTSDVNLISGDYADLPACGAHAEAARNRNVVIPANEIKFARRAR